MFCLYFSLVKHRLVTVALVVSVSDFTAVLVALNSILVGILVLALLVGIRRVGAV